MERITGKSVHFHGKKTTLVFSVLPPRKLGLTLNGKN